MAGEIRVQSSLTVRKTSGTLVLVDQRLGGAFADDMTGAQGPYPGAITVTLAGVNVDLDDQLSQPGYIFLHNYDPTNWVTWGIKDPTTGVFYPVGRLKPGKFTVFELSPDLQEQYTGSGTGTTAPKNYFHLKAHTAPCVVFVGAFQQ